MGQEFGESMGTETTLLKYLKRIYSSFPSIGLFPQWPCSVTSPEDESTATLFCTPLGLQSFISTEAFTSTKTKDQEVR